MQQLGVQLERLGCGYKRCGCHGFIFEPEGTGGMRIEGGQLHFWGCCANVDLDLNEAFAVLRRLPDGAGHKATCDSLRKSRGFEESPHCLYVDAENTVPASP